MILRRTCSGSAAAFIAFSWMAAAAAGQTADQKAAALDTVREYVRTYTASLPNYTCTQSTRQMITSPVFLAGGPSGRALRVDLIEEQLSFVNHREVRTVTRINDARPSEAGKAQIGTVSRGEFGNLLDIIFDPKTGADIRWDRAATLEGRRVNVFAYRVPQAHGYTLIESTGRITVPFEGWVYADSRTGAVLRIETKCTGIPRRSEYKLLTLTLDYKTAKVAGKEYLLPSRFNMRYEMTGNGAVIGAEYHSYRRFSADSTVKFDDDSGAANVTVEESTRPAPEPVHAIPQDTPIAEIKVVEPPPQIIVVPLNVDIIPGLQPKIQAPAAAPPDPVFRSSTQLVQVSVIAQDKKGKPVTDLRRDEFQVFDNTAQREIRLFLADRSDSEVPATQAPGAFTNRLGSGGASVLLFDRLFIEPGNDVFSHNVHARQRALQALKAIPPGDRIAIYSLACRFEVVRELTADRDSLLKKLDAFKPGAAPCADPTTVTVQETQSRIADPQTNADAARAKSHEQEGLDEIAARRQTDLGEYEFNVMADHLAGIPGRKNLIWVTSKFRLSPANVKRLIDANVAIYPVDIIGSWIAPDWAKKARYDPLRAMAAMSGGVAFFDRDDTAAGIRDALRDGRVSYTLGFYPSTEDDKAPMHQLAVRVSRPDVTLRYRTAYELKPPPPASANPVDDLVQALNRPVDATVILVTARATQKGEHVDLSVSLDVSTLDLELSEGLWKGQVELISRFMTADGLPVGATSAQTLTFNLRPATYASMLKGGDPYPSELMIPAKATELKVLVGNLASGKIGTLTIPLSEIVP